MPLYGSEDAIKGLVRADPTTVLDSDETARITALRALVSRYIEDATGATFGESGPPPATRELWGQGDAALELTVGLRSVSEIRENPTTWDGTAWSGGQVLAVTAYRLRDRFDQHPSAAVEQPVYREVRRVAGVWFGLYVITGVWEDRYPSVPDDLTYAANRMAAELYRAEKASPHGTLGIDGAQVAIRNALKIPELAAVIESYRVGRVRVTA